MRFSCYLLLVLSVALRQARRLGLPGWGLLCTLDMPVFFRKAGGMAGTIPADAVLVLERHLGSEDALVVVRGLEEAVQRATELSWARTRDELLVAMRREFVTRELFEERMGALRAELLGKIEADKAELQGLIRATREELLGKIEALRLGMDRKITVWSLVILFAVVLMNQDALEFVARLFGIVK